MPYLILTISLRQLAYLLYSVDTSRQPRGAHTLHTCRAFFPHSRATVGAEITKVSGSHASTVLELQPHINQSTIYLFLWAAISPSALQEVPFLVVDLAAGSFTLERSRNTCFSMTVYGREHAGNHEARL